MRKSLVTEIRDFQKKKKFLIPALLVLGLVGLVLPVLPGVALLVLALMLLLPGWTEETLTKIKGVLKLRRKPRN